jgi:hypothetical protein
VQDQSWREYGQGPSLSGDQARGYAEQGDGGAKTRARILVRIQPSDAAVYLNDQFVGTGEELSTLPRGLQVPPGQHTITVSGQGMATQERTVVVGPGKSETVDISLRPS